MFLRPIINGIGNYYIEAQTRDKTRTDVIVDYKGKRFIIELKFWRGKKYHNDGQVQLAEYLEQYDLILLDLMLPGMTGEEYIQTVWGIGFKMKG